MKVRSITCFDGRANALKPSAISENGALLMFIRRKLTDAGYEVQTVRLAVEPSLLDEGRTTHSLPYVARELERITHDSAIDYLSLGPLARAGSHDAIEAIPELIAATSTVFTAATISDHGTHLIDSNLLRPIARAIKSIAPKIENGFGNLRFAALAHCPPGIPFFPAAYARRYERSFALALECADLAVDASLETNGIDNVAKQLQLKIELHAQAFERLLNTHETNSKLRFDGCDWSLAPHPDESCSIGKAIESMSGVKFGEFGTLSAVAALTRAIQTASVRRVGFCGIFMPMLEDAILAQRAGPDFDLQKILLYSSVCGTGLDTIPLAGDVSEDAIVALLLDLATLAQIKQKPLTARLMPVPGLKAGDMTQFNFPYLVNGRVFKL